MKGAKAFDVLSACCVLWAEGELNWGLGLHLEEALHVGES